MNQPSSKITIQPFLLRSFFATFYVFVSPVCAGFEIIPNYKNDDIGSASIHGSRSSRMIRRTIRRTTTIETDHRRLANGGGNDSSIVVALIFGILSIVVATLIVAIYHLIESYRRKSKEVNADKTVAQYLTDLDGTDNNNPGGKTERKTKIQYDENDDTEEEDEPSEAVIESGSTTTSSREIHDSRVEPTVSMTQSDHTNPDNDCSQSYIDGSTVTSFLVSADEAYRVLGGGGGQYNVGCNHPPNNKNDSSRIRTTTIPRREESFGTLGTMAPFYPEDESILQENFHMSQYATSDRRLVSTSSEVHNSTMSMMMDYQMSVVGSPDDICDTNDDDNMTTTTFTEECKN
jgi:hypothetical protein